MARKVKNTKPWVYNRSEVIVCEHRFGLTDKEQSEIRKLYKKYDDIVQLARDVCGEPTLDEHSDKVIGTKNFIARVYSGKEIYNFTDDQINFIGENGATMKAMDITRHIFPDKGGALLVECKAVVALLRALNIELLETEAPPEDAGVYIPPLTDHKVLALINKADQNANYTISKLDSEKKRCIASLKNNLASPRFVAMANAFKRQDLRTVFETEYVKLVYQKPDLTSEENNGYINLANEYVLSISLTEEASVLKDALAEALGHEDGPKISVSLAQAISAKNKEYDDCQKRMIKLHEDLDGKRSERLKAQGIIKESLAKWIELCRTEEGRQYMLKLSLIKKNQLENEAKRIDSLEDLVAEFHGISIAELLEFNY